MLKLVARGIAQTVFCDHDLTGDVIETCHCQNHQIVAIVII